MIGEELLEGTFYIEQNCKWIPVGKCNEVEFKTTIKENTRIKQNFNGTITASFKLSNKPKYFMLKIFTSWSEETCRLFYKYKSVKKSRTRKKLFKRFLKSVFKDKGKL